MQRRSDFENALNPDNHSQNPYADQCTEQYQ